MSPFERKDMYEEVDGTIYFKEIGDIDLIELEKFINRFESKIKNFQLAIPPKRTGEESSQILSLWMWLDTIYPQVQKVLVW